MFFHTVHPVKERRHGQSTSLDENDFETGSYDDDDDDGGGGGGDDGDFDDDGDGGDDGGKYNGDEMMVINFVLEFVVTSANLILS